jgi:hypothetical protein
MRTIITQKDIDEKINKTDDYLLEEIISLKNNLEKIINTNKKNLETLYNTIQTLKLKEFKIKKDEIYKYKFSDGSIEFIKVLEDVNNPNEEDTTMFYISYYYKFNSEFKINRGQTSGSYLFYNNDYIKTTQEELDKFIEQSVAKFK